MDEIRNYRMLIDGEWVSASDGATFESVSPITGQCWARIPEATEADVERAVRAADRAFSSGPWAKMTPSERGKCLRKLGDLLAERSEELGRAETIDTGKMLKETRWQAKYIAEFFHFYAGAADKLAGHMPLSVNWHMQSEMEFRKRLTLKALFLSCALARSVPCGAIMQIIVFYDRMKIIGISCFNGATCCLRDTMDRVHLSAWPPFTEVTDRMFIRTN